MAPNPLLKNFRRRIAKLNEFHMAPFGQMTLGELEEAGEALQFSRGSSYSRHGAMNFLDSISTPRLSSPRLCLPPPTLSKAPIRQRRIQGIKDLVEKISRLGPQWGCAPIDSALRLDGTLQKALLEAVQAGLEWHALRPMTLGAAMTPDTGVAAEDLLTFIVHDLASVFPELPRMTAPPILPVEAGRFLSILLTVARENDPSQNAKWEALLAKTLDNESYNQLVEELGAEYSDIYPLCVMFEQAHDLSDSSCLESLSCGSVDLPCFIWDDCSAESETQSAFLEGATGIAARLNTKDEEGDIDLDSEDRALVDKFGWLALVQRFEISQDEKEMYWNIKALKDHWGSFFQSLFDKFPTQYDRMYSFMASDHYPDFDVTCVDDFRFVLGYYEAWDRLYNAIPCLDEDYEGGCGPDLEGFVQAVLSASCAQQEPMKEDVYVEAA